MTTKAHDQFAKQYLAELLKPLGKVEISREIPGEARQIDLYFGGIQEQSELSQSLGLLGQMISTASLFEPFRNQPSKSEIRSCLIKLFSLQSEIQRQARREKTTVSEKDFPILWIITSSASAALLNSFGFQPQLDSWIEGVYFLPEALKTALVAANQLPKTTDTLWLRILGKGKIQEEAIQELIDLPEDFPLKLNILEEIASWRVNIQLKQNPTTEERDLIMTLSPAYLKWREQTLLEGRQQGMQQGSLQERRIIIENLLKVKFGSLDEKLTEVIDSLLVLSSEEFSLVIFELVSLSNEEILERFGQN